MDDLPLSFAVVARKGRYATGAAETAAHHLLYDQYQSNYFVSYYLASLGAAGGNLPAVNRPTQLVRHRRESHLLPRDRHRRGLGPLAPLDDVQYDCTVGRTLQQVGRFVQRQTLGGAPAGSIGFYRSLSDFSGESLAILIFTMVIIIIIVQGQ